MEYQDELGLGWYDITARNYDPALGRWMNIDPLADNFPSMTPYNYALNNPLSFVDLDGKAPDPVLTKVVQTAIQNAPISRAIGRIRNAYYKVFNKNPYDSNPILASIPKRSKYIFKGGVGNAVLGSNEVNFSSEVNAFGRSFSVNGYFTKRFNPNLFEIDGVNVVVGSTTGNRYTTDAYGGFGGYAVDLKRGGATIIRLSLQDEETHRIFEKLLNDATNDYLNKLIEDSGQLGQLFELADLKDEVSKSLSQFNSNNPYDANSKKGKAHVRLIGRYNKALREYKKGSDNSEFWKWLSNKTNEAIRYDPN